MKISDMPNWVLKYKGKNKSIKYLGNDRYGLYEVTSKYDKDLGYSKSKQTFLGTISKENGLILKKRKINDEADYLEYGLSHFVYRNFKRNIQRSLHSSSGIQTDLLIKLVIVNYVFNDTSDASISMCYLCANDIDALIEYRDKITNARIIRASNLINTLLKEKIKDETDYNALINYLRLIVVRKDEDIHIHINDNLKGLLDKYGYKFQDI